MRFASPNGLLKMGLPVKVSVAGPLVMLPPANADVAETASAVRARRERENEIIWECWLVVNGCESRRIFSTSLFCKEGI